MEMDVRRTIYHTKRLSDSILRATQETATYTYLESKSRAENAASLHGSSSNTKSLRQTT
jgi:hypothetical protein